ncbi:hypothetical protein PG987_014020 [Apiospora arundinis]
MRSNNERGRINSAELMASSPHHNRHHSSNSIRSRLLVFSELVAIHLAPANAFTTTKIHLAMDLLQLRSQWHENEYGGLYALWSGALRILPDA